MSKNNRFVRVDCDKNLYHAYDGKKLINTISSDRPLEASFVEYFRVETEKVMAEIEQDDGPEAA